MALYPPSSGAYNSGSLIYNPNAAARPTFSVAEKSISTNPVNAYHDLIFGGQRQTLPASPTDREQFTNLHLPQAYVGTNLQLATRIEGLITSDDSFYTKLLLPWVESDQQTVRMFVWNFDDMMAPNVPYESPVRLITHSKKEMIWTTQRKGLGIKVENDMFFSEQGIKEITYRIRQLAQCIRLTINSEVLYTLMTCKSKGDHHFHRFNVKDIDLESMIAEEISMYASLHDYQKINGIHLLYHKITTIMEAIRNGQRPDTVIISPNLVVFLPEGENQKRILLETEENGGEGKQNVQMVHRDAFRGSLLYQFADGANLFQTRFFAQDANSPSTDLLSRSTRVGEYYPMLGDYQNNNTMKGYTTRNKGVYLYEENTDDWRFISFMKAFAETHLFSSQHGGWGSQVKALIEDYNIHGRVPPEKEFDFMPHKLGPVPDASLESLSKRQKGEKTGRFPFAKYNPASEKKWGELDYFGNMPKYAYDYDNLVQIALTLVAAAECSNSIEEACREWNNLLALLHDIEQQVPSEYYWHALNESNVKYSIKADGAWAGESSWKDEVSDWVPNRHGSMRLPYKSPGTENVTSRIQLPDMLYPSGFANWPGLKTLADEAYNTNSGWHDVGVRAQKSVDFLEEFGNKFSKIVPTSEALSAANRGAWFHKEDVLTVLVEYLASHNRPPIFLLFVSPGAATGVKERTTPKINITSMIFAQESHANIVNAYLKGLYQLKDDVVQGEKLKSNVRDMTYRFISPVTGNVVNIPSDTYKATASLQRELLIPLLLGYRIEDGKLADCSFRSYLQLLHQVKQNILNQTNTEGKIKAVEKFEHVATCFQDFIATLVAQTGDPKSSKMTLEERSLFARLIIQELAYLVNHDKTTIPQIIEKLEKTHQKEGDIRKWVLTIEEATQEAVKLKVEENFSTIDPSLGVAVPVFQIANLPQILDAKEAHLTIPPISGALRDSIRHMIHNATSLHESLKKESNLEQFIKDAPVNLKTIASQRPNEDVLKFKSYMNTLALFSKQYGVDVLSKSLLIEAHETMKPEKNDGEYESAIYRDRLRVKWDPADEELKAYHRTPLTMCLRTLEAISNFKSGHTLILPGDPDTAYKTPYNHTTTSVPPSLYQIPNYKNIRDLHLASYKPQVGELSFTQIANQKIGAQESIGVYRKREHSVRPEVSRFMYESAQYEVIHTPAFVERYESTNLISNPVVRVAAQLFLLTKCDTQEAWMLLMQNNVYVPMNIMLARPFIQHVTLSAIIMKAGIEAGFTLRGLSHTSVGYDALVKTFYISFTFHARPLVHDPKLVSHALDIACKEYQGGRNCEFIPERSGGLEYRINNPHRPSLFAIPLALSETDFSWAFTLTGGPYMRPLGMTPSYSTYELFNKLWPDLCSQASRAYSVTDNNWASEEDVPNTLVLLGTHGTWKSAVGRFSLKKGNGHLRNATGNGCKAVLSGQKPYLPELDMGMIFQ